ncbi:MAG TPA: TMEM175 family protein [Capillimicrobium sp.]|nr:TMEM175 family protein [Capillimicrobium sp.]
MAVPEPTHFDRDEREVEFTRALAFSDGVFGIAITLLVVSIDVPQVSGGDIERQLLDALDELGPFVGSYFISFAVVGLLWLRHHKLFSRIGRLDTAALVINLVLLSFVSLMPFSTEVMGRYGDSAVGTSIYATNLAVAAGAYTWLWWHCTRAGLLEHLPFPVELRLELASRLSTSVGFLLSIPVAFLLDARAAQVTWLLTIVGQQTVLRRFSRAGRLAGSNDR